MPCKCKCTCPLEVGDRIQHKPYPEGHSMAGIRKNGALILTLGYLGKKFAVYEWVTANGLGQGEVVMTREEFDNQIERWSP